jgi:Uma2 family endonuclease
LAKFAPGIRERRIPVQQEAVSFISEEDYLETEDISEIKHEYYEGEIFVMTGASEKHNLIASNLIITLGIQLKKRPCRVYPGDMRVKIEQTGLYTYPDVSVVCGERKFDGKKSNTLLNPDVIIEVLSDSTESYDRGEKFRQYRLISSLKEYVMVSQHSRKIEKYSRTEGQKWIFTETGEDSPAIELESIGCVLEISEVYDKTEDL